MTYVIKILKKYVKLGYKGNFQNDLLMKFPKNQVKTKTN